MFVPIPLEMKRLNETSTFPTANAVLILVNVVAWLFGCYWPVGPRTGVLSILTYGFCHYSFWHVALCMWVLWVFGKPLNQRLGNLVYTLVYLGSLMAVGLVIRLFVPSGVVGSSAAIFAVIVMALMLMPSTVIDVAYLACFPLSVVICLFKKPKYELNWILTWGIASVPAMWCLLVIPALELWSLVWRAAAYGWVWSWSPAAHLLGMLCGVILVLLLPKRISMPRTSWADIS